MIDVCLAGTGGMMPLPSRWLTTFWIEYNGKAALIDCGEGVQAQMVRYHVPMMKLDTIFISHIHGDHVFGLFGLLSTIGMKARTAPLNIYAPVNFGPILKFFLSFYGEGLSYEIRFNPLSMKEPEVIYSTKGLEVLSFPLNHKIETFGFIFREKRPQWNVKKEAIERYGFTLTEIGAIKRGEDVVRPGGVIPLEEVAYLPYEPGSYAYCSDTAPFAEEPEWLRGTRVIYHETTYLAELSEQAEKRHHSTTLQAAECALKAGARKLLIGHFSSRNNDPALYEAECRTVFPETYAVSDGDVVEI